MSDMIKIEIEFNKENGQVSINGPLKNHILTLGLLEEARRMTYKIYNDEDKGTSSSPKLVENKQPAPKIFIPRIIK